ncbi:MAG: hypothetical protein BHV94_03250 [Clostridiales bacterium 59_14]|nr:MAG: hypothetical protein BHV94_03250 [Clostridiales bacterium 59_14]
MENLINQLTSTHDKDAQVKLLQEIGKKLLTEYVIKIGDITIKPLWVEAYYSDTNTGFVDEAVHGNECQKNQYGALYFHHKTDDQRSGVDICLSCGNYYLSYLLKYTLVNGIFKSQAQLSSVIPHELRGTAKNVLVKEQNPAEVMVCTKRIGIMSSAYKDADLAIARDINQRFVTDSGEKKSLPQKTELLKAYIDAVYSDDQISTEEQKAAISRKLVGEYWKGLFE